MIGNSIITAVEHTDSAVGTVYVIRTDFGNTARLTASEIESLFYVSEESQNVNTRLIEQMDLLSKET